MVVDDDEWTIDPDDPDPRDAIEFVEVPNSAKAIASGQTPTVWVLPK